MKIVKIGRFRHVLLHALAFISLSACAMRTPLDEMTASPERWLENKTQLEQLNTWDINGRVAIQLENDSGSASLYWQQKVGAYKIRIIAPFGRGNLELNGDESGVSMSNGKGEIVHAEDAETLMLENLGWQVPVSGLYYWIRGIPTPAHDIDSMLLDDEARLINLFQAGWQVSFDRYRLHDELQLPEKMVLQNNIMKVKLSIKKWNVGL